MASTPIPSLSVLSVKSVVFLLRTLCRLQRNHGLHGLHGWEGALMGRGFVTVENLFRGDSPGELSFHPNPFFIRGT